MKFIKDNSYILSRLIVTQIGMMVFAIVLSIAAVSFEGILLFVSIFSILFYLVLVHVAIWPEGAKDIIRVESGRQPPSPRKGFLLGLLAAVPALFLLLLMGIGYIFGYAAMTTDFGMGLFGVSEFILSLIQAPYLGVKNAIVSSTKVEGITTFFAFGAPVAYEIYLLIRMLILAFSVLPTILISGLGYFLGYKNIYIISPNPNPQKPKK